MVHRGAEEGLAKTSRSRTYALLELGSMCLGADR